MPPLERTDLRQTAILWPFIGFDGYGQAMVGLPIEIPVRWLTQRTETLDPTKNTVTYDATAVVAQKIAVGSHMFLGHLSDWYGTGSGSALSDDHLLEVKAYTETPDIKNRNIRRTVSLMKLHNTP